MGKSSLVIVKNWAGIKELVQHCKTTRYASIDFETSGGKFANKLEVPTILGISFQIGSAWIIPLAHKDSWAKKEFIKILQYLSKELFENEDIVKVAWNLKFEHCWLLKYGCNFKGRIFDGMLAKYCLDEERPNDLKSMVQKLIPEFGGYEDEVDGLAAKLGWANVPLPILSKYCGLDCDLTLRLMCYFEKRLMRSRLYPLFRNLLMQASIVLAESEFNGITIDVPYLDKLITTYKAKIEENQVKLYTHKRLRKFERIRRKKLIRQLIRETQNEIEDIQEEDKPNAPRLIAAREEKISRYLAGEFTTNKERKILEPFNFNSPQQVVDLFYRSKFGFGFPIFKYTEDKKTKQPTDTPSTDEETLEKLQPKDKSGFITQLLTHRGLSKLYSTYMVGIREKIVNDRIHASFLLHGTVTGRLSSRDPNMQNIPRGDNEDAATIKKMFIAPKGYAIMQIDYSQAELRVMAEAANETSMIEWFNTGKDIHLASACKKYNVPYEEALKIYSNEKHKDFGLWKRRRKQAKTINFGIIYCQTAKALAESLSELTAVPPIIVSEREAQKFLDDFDRLFPKVNKFIKSQKKLAQEQGYVETFFGRKRRLPGIYSPQWGIMAEAQRQSVNAPIQGTASDFALFSSVLIRDVKDPKWDLRQIYTVHDSLGYLIKIEHIHNATPVINAICENPETKRYFGFSMKKVRMGVDFEIGTNWKELSKYDPKKDYIKTLARK